MPMTMSSTATQQQQQNHHRKIGIAVDLSDESAYAVKWAVMNYLRPGDNVILVHVRPTSVLYGADWGSIDLSVDTSDEESQQKLEDDFDAFTTTKAGDLSQPLVEAKVPFKIHIVKDHDMKERLCLEVERLGLGALIMGSRGFGASRRTAKGRLGSVSDYCVHHCVCPVVVVRFPEDESKTIPGEPRVEESIPEDEEEDDFHEAEATEPSSILVLSVNCFSRQFAGKNDYKELEAVVEIRKKKLRQLKEPSMISRMHQGLAVAAGQNFVSSFVSFV